MNTRGQEGKGFEAGYGGHQRQINSTILPPNWNQLRDYSTDMRVDPHRDAGKSFEELTGEQIKYCERNTSEAFRPAKASGDAGISSGSA
jgi:hypothetical protein